MTHTDKIKTWCIPRFFCFAAWIIFLLLAGRVHADDASAVIQAMIQANAGYHDESLHARMLIRGDSGNLSEREIDIWRWEGTANTGSRTLVRFTAPANLMNTALLSLQNKDRPDDQWLYLPAVKRTKRIVGASRGGSFAGSHFSYEDLAPFDETKYSYELLRRESCGDASCAVINAVARDLNAVASHKTIWVDTGRALVVKTEYRDAQGKILKLAFCSDLTKKDKYWRPYKTVLTAPEGGSTELIFSDIQIHAGLKESDFTERALVR